MKKKSLSQIVIFAVLFMIAALLFTCCKKRETIDKGCFYYSAKHEQDVYKYYYMTVDGVKYTLWTNDIETFLEYMHRYPDAKLVVCYDNTQNISQHYRECIHE